MKFHGDASPLSDEGLEDARSLLDIDLASFWAYLRVESGGFGFLPSRRPLICFERHIFHQFTDGRFSDANPDISNPEPGGHAGGPHEYARLNKALLLDNDAALQSTAWGIGQVMGCHHYELGYRSIEQMVEFMVRGEDEQLLAIARYMIDECINDFLEERDWEGIAERFREYGYLRENHAEKLAAAYERYRVAVPNLDIRGGQAALLLLGFDPGPVDGMIGPRTRAALVAFQRKRRYAVTGKLDQRTIDYLVNITFDMPR